MAHDSQRSGQASALVRRPISDRVLRTSGDQESGHGNQETEKGFQQYCWEV